MAEFRVYPSLIAYLVIFFLALLLISCGTKTDEELIMELMENVGKCVERKDISNLMMNLSEDYSDFESRGKSKTQQMVEEYFKRYRGIVIHVLSTRIDEVEPPEAFIQTEIAMSSGAAKVFRKLVRFSTDNYRFNIKLVKKERRWQILYAEWRYVSLDELYPESVAILKKIFPDLL